ncbi:uncharacterized protein [Elaeis guineensis]|uniref:uncharacterized protein n=1 Tax=Elaeis guineensis var. tenera TaxID=51953 RepID=UPI003C6D7D68
MMEDKDILFCLRYYDDNDEPLPGGFIVDFDLVNNFRIEQPPDLPNSGKAYCYVVCCFKPEVSGGPFTRDRRTLDGRGHWRCTHGESPVRGENGQIVGYKRRFKFHRLEPGQHGRGGPTNWAMAEYTLKPNNSYDNKIAVCVLWKTREV